MSEAVEAVVEFAWGALEVAADWWWSDGKRDDEEDAAPRPYPQPLYEERGAPPPDHKDLHR